MNNICNVSFLPSTVLFQVKLYGQHRISCGCDWFSSVFTQKEKPSLRLEEPVRPVRTLMSWWGSFHSLWQPPLEPLVVFTCEDEGRFILSPPHLIPSEQSGFLEPGSCWESLFLGRKDQQLWSTMMDGQDLMLLAQHPGRVSPFLPVCSSS